MYLSLHLERKIFLRYPHIIRAIWLHHFVWISPSLWFYGRSKIESKSSRFRCLSPYRLVASNLGRYKATYPMFAVKLLLFLNLLSWSPPFCPGWCLQPGQKALGPLSPSLSPRPSHSAHLFLAVLGSGGRSSCSFLHHICEDLWFPVHPSALKVWGLFFSSSLACIAHFIL